MKRRTFLSSVVFLGLMLTASAQAEQSPNEGSATIEVSDAVYSDFGQAGRLKFSPCPENAELECGTLDVPVDYYRPWGEKTSLAVIRVRASDSEKRIGVLFAHPGGHDSGVDFILGGVQASRFIALRERFDIVSFDPRGAGRSQPFLCGLQGVPAPDSEDDAALIAFLDDFSFRFSEACLDENRDFVLSISGNNFARDIEVLRRALHERQLSLAMNSNSGPVGGIYASLFPKRVRAMLIDSTVASEFEDYLLERPGEQLASYEIALRRIDQLCRRDAACELRETGVVAAFDTLTDRLKLAPETSPSGGSFDDEDLALAFSLLLPAEELWPLTVEALINALAGDYTIFFQIQEILDQPGASGPFLARICNDYGTRRAAVDYLPIARAVDSVYHRFFGELQLAETGALCSAWPPADPPVIRDVRRRVDTPIMLIGSEFDSDAPFFWTRRMAETLGMEDHVVRYQGGGHVLDIRSDVPCISAAIDDYLFDLKLPAKGLHCAANPISFASSAAQSSGADSIQPTSEIFLPLIER